MLFIIYNSLLLSRILSSTLFFYYFSLINWKVSKISTAQNPCGIDTRTSEILLLGHLYTCQTVNKFLAPLLGILSSYLVAIPFQFVSNYSILYFTLFLFLCFLFLFLDTIVLEFGALSVVFFFTTFFLAQESQSLFP